MAPQAKRRRSDDGTSRKSTNGDAVDVSQLKRHKDLWFDDGSIVVATDVHLYRVHKGVLARNSSVFKDMLELPNGAGGGGENDASTGGDHWNGIPLVKMAGDNDEGIHHLLMTLYDRGYYRANKPTSFAVILALLRLSSKYDIPAVRSEVIDHLKLLYPSELEDWDDKVLGGLMDLPDDGDFQLLANAMYKFSSQPFSTEDLQKLIAGREVLLKFSYELGTRALFPEKKCGSSRCLRARAKLHKRRMNYDSLETPTFDLDNLKHGLLRFINDEFCDNVCESCEEKSDDVVKDIREDFWRNIPAAFDLGTWDAVTNVDE